MIKPYIKYRVNARGKGSLHSPFLFEWYNNVVRFKGNEITKECFELVKNIQTSNSLIDAGGFGAGSRKGNEQRRIGELAKTAGTSRRWGRFLYKMSEQFGGKNVVELGTNLGIGSLYLAKGQSEANLHTFEGNKDLIRFAQEQLNLVGVDNVGFYKGKIQETLPTVLNGMESVDLAYIDADHTYEATIDFFKLLVKKMHYKSVFIFDDIHWSEGMEKAWEVICKDERVRVSVDLFFKGIVFFDPALSKEHFILKHG